MTFSKLFGYYGSRGIVLREETFIKNLGLKNQNGEFNILAQLLSDDSHIPLRVSIFDGETKGTPLFSVREFGNTCLLYSLDELLRYGDVLNLIQTCVDCREIILSGKAQKCRNTVVFQTFATQSIRNIFPQDVRGELCGVVFITQTSQLRNALFARKKF